MPRTTLLAMLCALLAPVTTATAQSPRDRFGDADYESRIDTTIAFDRRGVVSLSLGAGEIVVRAWERDQVHVRARSERGVIRMDASPARLSLELSRQRHGDTRYELTVPVGVRVSARAASGDVSISGTRGAVEARTQSGDVAVEDAADAIDLGSVSGDISGRRLAGSIEVNAISGSIELSDVQGGTGGGGDIEARSVSGDVDIRGAAARYVRAKTTSGDVTYDGGIDAAGRYELASHSGSVSLVIPRDASATLTVSTYSGAIDSDFPITLQPGEHGIGGSRRFTFEVGKAGGQPRARISAESFSGDISIRSTSRRPEDRR